MPSVRMRRRDMPMNAKDLESEWQARVLTALASVPLDQARLFESVCRSGLRNRIHGHATNEEHAARFFDALSLLRADGLVYEKPHPLRELRTYCLTEKGLEIAKGLDLTTCKRVRANQPQCRQLAPARVPTST